MKKILFLGILFIGIFIAFNMSLILAEISWSYKGEWYSKGFSEYNGWKNFMNLFFSALLKLESVEVNGTVGLRGTDVLGREFVNTNLVTFDKKTGNLVFSINLTLPSGEFKKIKYKISLNGEFNINKIINSNDYINKTIEEMLMMIRKNMINISLVGEKSNITLIPDINSSLNNPKFDIIYKRNVNDNTTSSIGENYANVSSSSNTTSQNQSENYFSTNRTLNETNQSINIISNKNESSEQGLKILNPIPMGYNILIPLNENVKFSVDNKDYDRLKWYVDDKIVKEGSNFYNFYGSQLGDYKLKIEIKKNNEIKDYSWRIKVEQSKEEKNYLWIYVALAIILILVVFLVFFSFIRMNEHSENS